MGFHERKTTQAAAQLLNLAKEHMPAAHLITLLYLVDREALLRWSRPVTGDTYSSTEFGPVLDRVSELLATHRDEAFWSQVIATIGNEAVLRHQPGRDELSEAEEELIHEIYWRFCVPDQVLPAQLATILPEWAAVDQRRPIRYADILRADQRSPEEIEAIEQDIAEVELVHSLFTAP
jgi:Protein of unknown function (DUF4065)